MGQEIDRKGTCAARATHENVSHPYSPVDRTRVGRCITAAAAAAAVTGVRVCVRDAISCEEQLMKGRWREKWFTRSALDQGTDTGTESERCQCPA